MAARIYALAKELNIDSKDLVEICRKAGIPGKGSALASLTDEEVVKVKAFLSAGDKKRPDASEASRQSSLPLRVGEPIRPTPPPVRHAEPHRPAPLTLRPSEPARQAPPETVTPPPAPIAPPPPSEAPAIPVISAVAPVAPPETPPTPPPVAPPAPPPVRIGEPIRPTAPPARSTESMPYTRGDYIAPGPVGRIKVLDVGRSRSNADKAKDAGEDSEGIKAPRKRRDPVIKLAELPQVQQPGPSAKPEEPKAQKPDIRLPKDAIAGHLAGQRPKLDQLEKAAERAKEAEAAPEKRGGGVQKGKAAAAEPADGPLSGKGAAKRKKSVTADDETVDRGLAGMASARADRQKSRKTRGRKADVPEGEEDAKEVAAPVARRPKTLVRRHNVNTAAPRKEKAALELPCTIRSFSEATGISATQVLKKLLELGMTTLSINAQIDGEMAQMLAVELSVELEFKQPANMETTLADQLLQQPDDPAQLQPRPPVVTFLGHVDHGKTSLLDHLIGIDVVSGEAGGITQHIRAYQIEKDGRRIAFVDTPGHEAFTEMRARGANVTDIAVLVVAADDGVMPQTEEAISHAKAAGVPIVVALNKIDLPAADRNRVMQQLLTAGLLPSEWGGDVEVISTSATKGTGMDALLENILLTAEMHDYQANPSRPALGVCLESEQESGRGVIAKLIVKNGTLRVGDIVVCGTAYGRVKSMYDTLKPSVRVREAGPSTPVNVTGFDQPPEAGDKFYVLPDISQARELAEERAKHSRQVSLSGSNVKVSFEEFQRRLSAGRLVDASDVVTLNLILRADVRGSIEAIEKELGKLEHPEVRVSILHKSVGAITAGDVMLAHASQAVILGFNVIPDEAARALADEKQVEIRRYDIIYKVTDDIKALLEGKLRPEERVVELGHAVVKRVFPISRVGTVAGCYVVKGAINRGCRIRVNRDGRTIGDYEMESLRREKDDVKEVPRGMECGIKLAGFNDIKQDDILEAYRIEEVARTL